MLNLSCHVQLPVTLLHLDVSGNGLTRLDALEALTSLRWLDASHNALKASPLTFPCSLSGKEAGMARQFSALNEIRGLPFCSAAKQLSCGSVPSTICRRLC